MTAPPPAPARRTLGRYLIVGEVVGGAAASGSGGGAALSAFDPELSRRLELRILGDGPEAERALADAQAQARLRHAHVIPVHDIGHADGVRFLALGLTERRSLADLLAAAPHRDLWPLLLQAGAALSAAAELGLDHRDFGLGAVFLLAEGHAAVDGLYQPAPDEAAAAAARTRGRFLDAAEALSVALPGPTRRSVRRALRRARASGEPLPQAVERLARAGAQRRPGWRRWLAAGAALLILAAGAVALRRSQARRACREVEERALSLWSPGVEADITAALRRGAMPLAQDTARLIGPVLREYLRAWSSTHGQACTGEGAGRDARLACLEGRLARVSYLIGRLRSPGDDELGAVLERAGAAVRDLADPRDLLACEGAAAADAPPPPPPPLAAQVAALRAQLGGVEAELALGRYAAGQQRAAAIVEAARPLGYRPLLGEALYWHARLLQRSGDSARAEAQVYLALAEAEAGRHDRLAAQGWLLLAYLSSEERWQGRRAEQILGQAAAQIRRCGRCEDLWAEWHQKRGHALFRDARGAEALAAYAEARRAHRSPPAPLFLMEITNSEGNAHASLDHLDEALRAFRAAAALAEANLGPQHPSVAMYLSHAAEVLEQQGDYAASLAAAERAHRIRLAALPPGHHLLAETLGTIGVALQRLGRLPEAHAHMTEALARYEAAMGPDHPRVSYALLDLGNLELAMKRPAQALRHFERATALREKAMGPDHVELTFTLTGSGVALLDLGRPAAAAPLLERSLRLGGDHPGAAGINASARFGLARARLGRSRAEAAALSAQALAAFQALGPGYLSDLEEVRAWRRAQGLGSPGPR